MVSNKIDYIVAFNGNKLEYHFNDNTVQEVIWKDKSRSESWTPEMREMARQTALKQYRKEDN